MCMAWYLPPCQALTGNLDCMVLCILELYHRSYY